MSAATAPTRSTRRRARRSAPAALAALALLALGDVAQARRAAHETPEPREPAVVAAARAPAARAAAPVAPRVAEVVFSDFDLAGWRRLGQLTLETSPLDMGGPDDLLDRDMGTQTRTAGVNPARFAVSFATPRVVRRVVLAPGTPDSYAVGLSVVKADGGRFAAGELVVSDADAVFRLRDVAVRSFELTVERLERDDYVHVAEIRVNGELTINALALEDLPTTIPEGGSFPVRIHGQDDLGGRPDLTPIAQLVVNPARAVALLDSRRAVTRVGGPLSLSARLGQLQGPVQPMLVQPLGAAPPAPGVRAAFGHVEVSAEGEPPFEVLRRDSGEKVARAVGVSYAASFLDTRVEPGAAYQYSVRRVDRFGNALSKPSAEGRARALPRTPEHTLTPGRFPVLVVLYVDSFGEGEEAAIRSSLEAARLFLYRHSRGRMIVETQVLRLRGPTPSTAGPSMQGIEDDLRRRGLRDDAFGAVFAVSNDIAGSYGNFPILGRAGGAMGRRSEVVTPDGPLGDDPRFAWTFVHELWHALVERAALAAGLAELPSGHTQQDFARGLLGSAVGKPFDAGEAWDGQAALLAGVDFWEQLGRPYRVPLATLDSDDDGLPDDDPRLPIDERRFGTDPQRADTDGDGLDDMAELVAGLYAPSNPLRPDTDGDGLRDGDDPWPVARFAGVIPHGTEPALLARGPDPSDPLLELAASWTDDALHLVLTAPAAADVFLELDGSGELGRWESDARVTDASDVWAGAARLALRAVHEPRGVFVGSRAVEGAELSAGLDDAGRWRLVARLPAAALGAGARDVFVPAQAASVAGLRLAAGRTLGLMLSLRPSRVEDPSPFVSHPAGQPWTGLFETHRFYDAVLQPPLVPDAPAPEATAAVGEDVAADGAAPSEAVSPDATPTDEAPTDGAPTPEVPPDDGGASDPASDPEPTPEVSPEEPTSGEPVGTEPAESEPASEAPPADG